MEVQSRSVPEAVRRDAKREAIRRAAIDQFAARGFGGTSMAHIAEASGMSRPALYQYFRDKDDIFASAFVALFEDLVDQAMLALRAEGSTAEQLEGFLQRYEGDLWQRMEASPHVDEILRTKNADIVAAVGKVVARLTDALALYVKQHSPDPGAHSEWVDLLRWSPKGLTYDRPSVATYRRRLKALARAVAAELDPSQRNDPD